MKLLLVGIFFAAPLAAQYHALTHPLGMPGPSAGALGGGYVAPALTRPLGGVSIPGSGRKASGRTSGTGGYVGPVYYVPDAFGTSYYPDTSQYSLAAPAQTAEPPQPPVIINQYFVTNGSSIPGQPGPPRFEPEPSAAPANPGDPLSPPENYYLIAYKDHTIYSALAYWVEGDTLHYVTTENTHNQASLGLIDVDRTYKLNADRSVPFSLPGK